jgi:hypothetical protein
MLRRAQCRYHLAAVTYQQRLEAKASGNSESSGGRVQRLRRGWAGAMTR